MILRFWILLFAFLLEISSAESSMSVASVDFGKDLEVPLGYVGLSSYNRSYSIKIKNNSDRDLLVENLRSSCGCLDLVSKSLKISKRKSSDLIFRFNTQKTGDYLTSILGDASIPEEGVSTVKMKFSFKIVSDLFQNISDLDFGEISSQDDKLLTVYGSNSFLKSIKLSSTFKCFSVAGVSTQKVGFNLYSNIYRIRSNVVTSPYANLYEKIILSAGSRKKTIALSGIYIQSKFLFPRNIFIGDINSKDNRISIKISSLRDISAIKFKAFDRDLTFKVENDHAKEMIVDVPVSIIPKGVFKFSVMIIDVTKCEPLDGIYVSGFNSRNQ